MELELEAGGGGRVVPLSSESPAADLGRGDQAPADLNVSRRHVSLRLVGGGEPRVAFDVVGRNPVLVRSSFGGDKVYRRGEAGELRAGDGLSLSLSAPSFWTVRRTGGEGEAGAGEEAEVDTAVLDAVARREKRTRERKERERERRAAEEATEGTKEEVMAASGDDELDEEVEDLKIDLESIDPVQEFGFLSMGHEFDNYPKGRIRPPKDWNWFLEEITKGSDDEDDDDVSNTGRKSRGRSGANKKKKRGGEDDDEWTDQSEDGKDSLLTGSSMKRPKKYVTRSKDPKKPRKESSKTENEDTADEQDETDEDDEDDEADETLGGFIVGEEDEPMEELSEEEEEDEFDDEDEDD
ncbi:hypothetical protein CFC21_098675 [Triticum aestivum]|uniref:FHA domain-containing protein n=3 Tax=Triticum TaxID=4564 RepID=A0A9R0ZIT4_TRITD|nr:uncharacterized protein DDB_G0286299-like [Triticum dicoccoides]XP_044427371.1 uncharacterized protein DDB_G0286299-like [Triticum aestivum]KAF7096777.1 hypothetical protein CFC21_098675 [Triticum aestivum]VAI77585.1 unnamed protein product [Triticum turgidum subsp. durum]